MNSGIGGILDWKSKLLAALSYFGMLCFVPLFVNKDDEFVAFHAKQGLILWIWAMAAFLFAVVPGIGPLFFQISTLIIPILSLVGLVSVAVSKTWRIPVVHGLTARI